MWKTLETAAIQTPDGSLTAPYLSVLAKGIVT